MTQNIKIVFACAVTAAAATACSARSKSENQALSRDFLPGVAIVYSANVDGEIEPCGCRSNPTGGLNRRWNLQQTKLPKGERLVIDSGDLFYQSSPVPPFLEKQWNHQARVLLAGFNMLGVEVFAPGDLDFAAGFDKFKELTKAARFKVVSANIYTKASSKRAFAPYAILNKGGKRVGLFGIYDETLPLPEELMAVDHVQAASEMVSELRKKADVIIAMTHIGLEKDRELAKKVQGIDAIFGAHSQSFISFPEKVGDTLIFQPSFRGQHVGGYWGGDNSMFQVDERFDSPEGQETAMDRLVQEAKAEIARLNKESEDELMTGKAAPKLRKEIGFQTFTQCAQCHFQQHEFHRGTPHFKAYQTLINAKQNNNLDCLKCHTTGAPPQPGGWSHVGKLVINNTGKAIDAESFAASAPNADIRALSKISKSFINVQCENCHGAGGTHPVGTESKLTRAPTTATCLQCHTPDRAPGWYKNGKLDQALVEAKFKSLSCPPTKR